MTKKIFTIAALFLIAFNGLSATVEDRLPTRRFGVFIGANNGGRERVMLRYAVSDARSVSHVFASMGGIAYEDNFIMVEPTVREINRQLDNVGRLVSQSRRYAQRTELVFYYSGHSDEDGIFLNRERYGYRELRERINTIQADMRIIILDSCSSGAMTRVKGGTKVQPFLFDTSISAEGFAILTSSSADEVSMESDSIESSYFTHSLLAGLRGAADTIGDRRVTLNELYRFAYTETLARTETSLYGAQHPSFDIQISGSGDVVLTDIREISASIVFAEDITGRISIRDSSEFLVAELSKLSDRPLELGLESGSYHITLQTGNNFYQAAITLTEGRRTGLRMENFHQISASSAGRRRGDEPAERTERVEDVPVVPLDIQFIPGFNMFGPSWTKRTSHILAGIFVGIGHNVNGVGAGSLGIVNTGSIQGLQVSGGANFARGNIDGLQTAGIASFAGSDIKGAQVSGMTNFALGDVDFLQTAGIANFAWGGVSGAQIAGIANYAGKIDGVQVSTILNVNNGGRGVMVGLVNISKSEDVTPIGLVNIIKNGILHPAVYVDDMLFTNISLRSGGKHFYGLLSAGVRPLNNEGDIYTVTRGGFGFEIPIKKAFVNSDFTSGSMYKRNLDRWWNTFGLTNVYQARLTFGYKFLKHLGIFAGISYDYFQNVYSRKGNDISVDPRDLAYDGFISGSVNGRNYHKVGFFGGVQF